MRPDDRAPSLPRVRIVVLGSARVGKSALIVRYLTRRFIGEYHSNTDLLYTQTVPINGTQVDLEVFDVSGSNPDNFPTERIQWADACLIVYSVTDRESFNYATEMLSALRSTSAGATSSSGMPLALLGNKTDLDHLRQVPTEEGRKIAVGNNASFSEASVADNTGDLYRAIDKLLGECRSGRVRKFSVTKMLGNLIGSSSTSSQMRTGSVVACPKVPPTATTRRVAAAAP